MEWSIVVGMSCGIFKVGLVCAEVVKIFVIARWRGKKRGRDVMQE